MTECKVVLILAAPEVACEVKEAAEGAGLRAIVTATTADALSKLQEIRHNCLASVVCALGTGSGNSCWPLLDELRKKKVRQAFVVVHSRTASQDAKTRMDCFDAGANMVSSSMRDTTIALGQVATVLKESGPYACPKCSLSGLTENSLHLHMHFHHAVEANLKGPCPICRKECRNLEVHVHNEHGPPEEREPSPAPYAAFAWCVCQHPQDGRFLMVNEPAGISGGRPGYWLPAGRVDKGETLVEACRREALEEAGVAVQVSGVLRFMVDSHGTIRVVLFAVPEDNDNCEPKNVPDWESVGALWTDVNGLDKLADKDYRSPDPADLFPKVASGELQVHSLDTAAFRELEEVIQRLTAGESAAGAQLPAVWKKLKSTYPPSIFSR